MIKDAIVTYFNTPPANMAEFFFGCFLMIVGIFVFMGLLVGWCILVQDYLLYALRIVDRRSGEPTGIGMIAGIATFPLVLAAIAYLFNL